MLRGNRLPLGSARAAFALRNILCVSQEMRFLCLSVLILAQEVIDSFVFLGGIENTVLQARKPRWLVGMLHFFSAVNGKAQMSPAENEAN